MFPVGTSLELTGLSMLLLSDVGASFIGAIKFDVVA